MLCSAFIGIGHVLTYWDDARALLTTATVAAGNMCGLACGATLESRRARITPIGGLAFTLVGVVCMLSMIWRPMHSGNPSWEWWLRVTLMICTIAVSLTHISLLSLCRLAPRYRWAKVVAVVAILAVAGLVGSMLSINHHVPELLLRWTVVAAILDAAMSILLPVFHLLSRKELGQAAAAPESPAEIHAEIARLEARLAELRGDTHRQHRGSTGIASFGGSTEGSGF